MQNKEVKTESKSLHTKGEWTTGTTESGTDNCKRAYIYSEFPYDMQETICVMSGLNGTDPGVIAKANAAHIVKCVNGYDTILEENKRLKNALHTIYNLGRPDGDYVAGFCKMKTIASKALNSSTVKEVGSNG